MNIMHIDASQRSRHSVSRNLSTFFIHALQDQGFSLNIDRLDLAVSPPDHFGPAQIHAIYQQSESHTATPTTALAASDALVDRVMAAEALVMGVPMYNFGMPSVFKAFVDHISRSDRTFSYTNQGIEGHLKDKKMVVLASAGGNYRTGAAFDGLDFLTPHIQAVFQFLGASPRIILAHPTTFEGQEMKKQAIEEAEHAALAVAKQWARSA